jgi:hypothetical protein
MERGRARIIAGGLKENQRQSAAVRFIRVPFIVSE